MPRAVVCLWALVPNGLNPSQADAIERLREFEQDGRLADFDIIAGEILQMVYHQRAERVSVLEHDNAEVLEIVVDSESILAGDTLSDVAHHLPAGFVIGAIIRGGTLKTPRGSTIIQTGDRVIAFIDAEEATEVAEKI